MYLAVNLRRFAFGVTSALGLSAPDNITLDIIHASLALLVFFTNCPGADCLSYVGTEGSSTRAMLSSATK